MARICPLQVADRIHTFEPLTRLFRFFQYFISRLESVFLRLTQTARSSLGLSAATDFTRSRSQLIAENALLRQQLIILTRHSKKPRFTRSDRLWLVLLASRVQHWRSSLLVLQPDTLLRWHREGFRLFWKFKSRDRGGRPRLSAETIALIQQMAKDNRLWESERIRGERRKLGIWVATATVQKYVRAVCPTHSPDQNWLVFLQNHAQDVWACDFLPVIDLFFRPVYVFFITELASRRVIHFNVTHRPTQVQRYQKRISGLLLDRIDIHITVPSVHYEKLSGNRLGETPAAIRARVEKARERQRTRFAGTSVDGHGPLQVNADMGPKEVRELCELDEASRSLIRTAMKQMNLSARAYHRILKLAPTIADLADCDRIETPHLAEAIQYRPREQG